MRRLLLFAALTLAAATLDPSAQAQLIEAYATFSPTHAGNVQTGTLLNGSTYQNQYTSFFAPAIGGGITLNVLPLGPIRIGLDLRGSTKSGTTGIDTALAGIKLAIKPPLLPIKPYVQVSGGYVATRTANLTAGTAGATFGNQYAAVEGLAGVDYHFLPFLNLRLIEFGYGKGFNSGISFGSTSTQNDLNFYTINTGLVLHF